MYLLELDITFIKDVVLITIPITTLIVTSYKDIYIKRLETKFQLELENVTALNNVKIKKLENKLELEKEFAIKLHDENRKYYEEINILYTKLRSVQTNYFGEIDFDSLSYRSLVHDVDNTKTFLDKIVEIYTMFDKYTSTLRVVEDGSAVYNENSYTELSTELMNLSVKISQMDNYDSNQILKYKQEVILSFHKKINDEMFNPLFKRMSTIIVGFQNGYKII